MPYGIAEDEQKVNMVTPPLGRTQEALGPTLGQFVKELTALLADQNIGMPFKNERSWHLLFYELKKDRGAPGRPAFLDEMQFDWDGPFPKSQELSDFLHSLHWNASVSAVNPHYDFITLPEEMKDIWMSRYTREDKRTKDYFKLALARARAEFGDEPGEEDAGEFPP